MRRLGVAARDEVREGRDWRAREVEEKLSQVAGGWWLVAGQAYKTEILAFTHAPTLMILLMFSATCYLPPE